MDEWGVEIGNKIKVIRKKLKKKKGVGVFRGGAGSGGGGC